MKEVYEAIVFIWIVNWLPFILIGHISRVQVVDRTRPNECIENHAMSKIAHTERAERDIKTLWILFPGVGELALCVYALAYYLPKVYFPRRDAQKALNAMGNDWRQ